jgi:DNA-directed RNA polymerase beta subunit
MLGKFDYDINPDDTYQIIHSHVIENGFVKHATESMDDFYNIGLSQIMMKNFTIKETFPNERQKTPEDRQIDKIGFEILLDNIRLRPPTTSGYCSGQEKIIYPTQAHLEDRTYSSNMYVDAKINTTAYLKDGQEKTNTKEIKNHRLSGIPVMTKTTICNTFYYKFMKILVILVHILLNLARNGR